MHVACWIPKATNTHSQYVTLIAFPLQQQLHLSASLFCYTYISSLAQGLHKVLNPGHFPNPPPSFYQYNIHHFADCGIDTRIFVYYGLFKIPISLQDMLSHVFCVFLYAPSFRDERDVFQSLLLRLLPQQITPYYRHVFHTRPQAANGVN